MLTTIHLTQRREVCWDGGRRDLTPACSKCAELVDEPIGVMAKQCK